MDDATLYERMLDSMEVWFRLVAERTVERDGVLAAACPSIPERSVFNSVIYRAPAALIEAVPELERTYDEAGVAAWTVWVPQRHADVRAALERAGNVLDAWPEAMAAPLADIDVGAGAEGLDWERSQDVEAMCSILGEAFHWPAERTPAVFATLPAVGHIYLARMDGEPVASVVALDHAGDCAIWNVGTREAARGRGLATGLMRQALLDARERGCETTSLQATQVGRPVYRRLGYREMGAIEMWERRHS
jgi:ribosomal protein S18 acetylase RimI-like enzyme